MSLPSKARSTVLPIATLGELLAHGFEVHVWCPRCHEFRRPTIPAARLRKRFAGARFRYQACKAPGYPSFRPECVAAPGRYDHWSVLWALPAAQGYARRLVRAGPRLDLSGLPASGALAATHGAPLHHSRREASLSLHWRSFPLPVRQRVPANRLRSLSAGIVGWRNCGGSEGTRLEPQRITPPDCSSCSSRARRSDD